MADDIHTMLIGTTGSKKTLAGVLHGYVHDRGESSADGCGLYELYRYMLPYLQQKGESM